MLKNTGVIVAALVFLLSYIWWPQPCVVVLAVAVVVSIAWLRKLSNSQLMSASNSTVLITGCDTGFGHTLALHLDRLDAIVFAGCLHAEGPGAVKLKEAGSDRMHVLQMDVTSDDQVAECLRYVVDVTNSTGLWGLVNNAGLNLVGDAELTTIDQYINQVSINQLGVVRVTKAFLPELRRRKGRIVNVTSVKGLFVSPFTAAYTMTKFALEAFSDALRIEMNKFDITVSVVEPGHFGGATESINMERISGDYERMWQNMTVEQRRIYGRQYIDRHIAAADACRWDGNPDVSPVTFALTDALFSTRPRSRYLVHGGCGRTDLFCWNAIIAPFVPTWLMDRWLLWNIRDLSVVAHTSKRSEDAK